MNGTVSILIPSFNAERWVRAALESAVRQTWPRKEIIVVDDGSSDRTVAVASRYAARGVTVVQQTNAGAAAARNRAFQVSKGDYIQWLDADDLLAPDKIARQMEALKDCPGKRTLLSSEWGHFIYRPAKATFVPTPLWSDLTPIEWLIRKMETGTFMQTATLRIPAKLNAQSGQAERGFRASRTLIGAQRRRQAVS